MSTRGAYGFVVDGVEKITYNHFDSYLSGVGETILQWLHENDLYDIQRLASKLKIVDPRTEPTFEEIKELINFAQSKNSPKDITEWYFLLYLTHGDLDATLEAGYLIDDHDFPRTSTQCNWTYIIDLDKNVFEIYRLRSLGEPTVGRFATDNDGTLTSSSHSLADEIYAASTITTPTSDLARETYEASTLSSPVKATYNISTLVYSWPLDELPDTLVDLVEE